MGSICDLQKLWGSDTNLRAASGKVNLETLLQHHNKGKEQKEKNSEKEVSQHGRVSPVVR